MSAVEDLLLLFLFLLFIICLDKHSCFGSGLRLGGLGLFDWGVLNLSFLLFFRIVYNITDVNLCVLFLNQPFEVLRQRSFNVLPIAMAAASHEGCCLVVL